MNNDLISREALKKHITEIFETEEKIDKKWAMGLKYSLKLIDNAPTAELLIGRMTNGVIIPIERPQGEWIKNEGRDLRDCFYTCSKCGRNINVICGETLADYPFCHCGASMIGGETE